MNAVTLVELLRWRALEQPQRRAYTFLVDGETEEAHLTYGDLDLRARAVAAWLQELKLAGERVLLVYPSGLDYLAGFFGCLYAGAVAVPAYPPRLNRSLARLEAILEDTRSAAALTTTDLLEGLEARLPAAPALGALRWIATNGLDRDAAGVWRNPGVGPGDLAFLQYTSASTAAPRGVMLSHGNLLHNQALIRRAFPQPEDAVGMGWLPPYHDMGLIGQVLQPLYGGFPCVFMAPAAFLQKPARWLQAISRHGATGSGGPNFAYELCVEKVTPEQRQGLDLSRWSVAFNGAEPIRPDTLERFAAAFAACGFRREVFYLCYGLAEATLIVSGAKAAPVPVVRTFQAAGIEEGRAVPVGPGESETAVRRLAGSGLVLEEQRVAIVDPDFGTECPPGRIGEIWVCGASVAQGYWGREEETEATFRACLANREGPFLRTGDLGFVENGELFVTGRSKDLIIIRGRNHYPHDIECTVERSHPDLLVGAGAAFSVEVGGEERLAIVQEVQRHRVRQLAVAAVAGAIRRAVAEVHELQVYAVVLVRPLTLPKTSSGKIQRHLCRAACLAGGLETVGEWCEDLEAGSPPAAATVGEEVIHSWLVERVAERLGVAVRQVDSRASLAHYGFDSAQILGLMGELEAWLGRRLDPTLLYEYPTIDALARHLAPGAPAERPKTPGPCRHDDSRAESVAIVGMACRFPGALGIEAFWRLLRDGVDAITEVPAERRELAGPTNWATRWGGFLTEVDLFDPLFFGINHREAASIDPQQRLLLETAWEALEDAGQTRERLTGSRTSVFVGISTNDYSRLQTADSGSVDTYSATGNALSIAANRLSYTFDLRGPSLAVDTACSSSLVAVHLACRSLASGECNLALAAGVNLILSPEIGRMFSRAGALAADGRCKAFDASADGFVRSEGAGCVVLKPLARALADGDPIYAVIRGSAVNQDGRTNGLMAPSPQAQEAVLLEAYARAGVSPGEVQYVETHGTGTLLGDPIEARALGRVLAQGRPSGSRCLVGSVKTNLGHLESAAGIAGLIKTALALRHGEIPPSLYFREPNPHIPFDELPLCVQQRLGPWPESPGLTIAGVSSFGFGGTNAHVVLEAAPAAAEPAELPPAPHLLPLSAHTREALAARAQSWLDFLDPGGAGQDTGLADLAYTAAVRRSHHDFRLALVVRDREELREGIDAFLRGEKRPGLAVGSGPGERLGTVFVLCGQGPQWPGMGCKLARQEPVFHAVLDECDRRLVGLAGWSLWEELAAPQLRSRLAETEIAQPTLFALQVALAALWRYWGVGPAAVVGHSAGEVAAAHVAGVLSLEEGLRLAVERGRFLQRAAGGGQMAQIEISPEEAELHLARFVGRLTITAINAPRSVVVSGDLEAVEALLEELRARGVSCRALPWSYAFHGPRLDPFLDGFEAALAGLAPQPAAVSLVSTLTGKPAGGKDWDAGYWRRQARQPVNFAAAIGALLEGGHRTFLEIGPHPVLSPALAECLCHRGLEGHTLSSLRRREPERAVLLRSLAALYARGQAIDWSRFHKRGGRSIPLPSYPWQRERCWLEERSTVTVPAPVWREYGPGDGHPLLGHPLPLAHQRRHWLWESELKVQHLRLLEDHRIDGVVVVPSTAYVEMAMAAAAEVWGQLPGALVDVCFRSPLVVPEGGSRRVQVVLAAEGDGEASFRIFSRLDGGGGDGGDGWTLHASGRVRSSADDREPREAEELAAIRKRCTEDLAGADYYPLFLARGLQYGPRFQGIERLWRGRGEALGKVSAPPGVIPELDAYHIHPAILDACGQVVAATDGGNGHGVARSFLPVGIEELRVYGRPGRRLWSHARCRAEEGSPVGREALVGDARLLDEEGRVLVEARGLRLQYLSRAKLHPARPAPADWFYELRWEPVPAPAPSEKGASSGLWLIFADGQGTGEVLAGHLAKGEDCCWRVYPGPAFGRWDDRFQIRPGEAEDVRCLLDALGGEGDPPLRGVVHLWSLDVPPSVETTVASLESAELHGCGSLLPLVQELARRGWSALPRLWLVTRGAQPVAGAGKVAVAQAPLWGFGRSLAQEHPELMGGLIDLEPVADPATSAEGLAQHIRTPGGETQVAWRGGILHAARLARRRDLFQEASGPHFRVNASYLITGGLGGLGLEVARWMVTEGARRLVLLGRTPLPPRTTWVDLDPESRLGRQAAAVRELESLGAVVHLAPVDVADEGQLAAFIEEFRREAWPPIRGVIHAAGVLQDQTVLQLNAASLAAVFRAKVLGGWLLHRLLGDTPLDFFLLFSSAASLLGSAGQANYAAANAFLDALAHHRRAAGKPALSINWGPWAEVGIAAQGDRQEHLARQGFDTLRPEEGLEILGGLIRRSPVQVGILPVDWDRLFDSFPAYYSSLLSSEMTREASEAASPQGRQGEARKAVEAIWEAAPAERLPKLEALLREQVARVVGISPSRLDSRRPLNDLGIDSLMAAELKTRVERELGIAVSIVQLLENPSLVDFAAALLGQIELSSDGGLRSEDPGSERTPRSLLLVLRAEGSRSPFFCVHPGALEVQCYSGLVRGLGREQPFYALLPPELDNYRGLEGKPTAEVLLTDVAVRCAEALRSVQARGPYRLGGWSMGGVMAWQVAERLREEGEEVARLVLLDSPAPPSGGEPPTDYDDAALLPVFARYLGARCGRKLWLSGEDFALRDPEGGLRRLLRKAQAAKVVPPNCDVAQLAAALRLFKEGLLRSLRQLWSCRPRAVPYPLTFLRPAETLEAFGDLFPDPAGEWARLASIPLEVREVPGDHYTLFLGANARELATQLRRSLEAQPAAGAPLHVGRPRGPIGSWA